jgi:hypothetical protein
LLDDALVEAVGLLVGEQQRGFDHRLLAQLLELEARAEHHACQHQHCQYDHRQEQEREQSLSPRTIGHGRLSDGRV